MTMTEDELMRGITDALTFGGWTWMHIIRSDGVTAGGTGFPDIVAYHPGRHLVILWELKGERTPITPEQASWIANTSGLPIDAAIVRPVDYDAALGFLLNHPKRQGQIVGISTAGEPRRFPFADLRRPGTGFQVESVDPLVLKGPAFAPGEIEPR